MNLNQTSQSPVLISSNWGLSAKPIVRAVLLALGGSLFVALLAQLQIPLPFTPVPISGQTFGVLLVGSTLGAGIGALSLMFYLAQGAIGLPFFSGGEAGIQHLSGATAGYLFGFVLAAWIVGKFAESKKDRKFSSALLGFGLGHLTVFACGILWLSQLVGFSRSLELGLYPFMPGMILKTAIAAGLIPLIWKWKASRKA